MSVDLLIKMSLGQVMFLDDMKPGIRQLLVALDYLQSQCHIIHTSNMSILLRGLYYRPNSDADLQLKNLLLPGPETLYLSRFEEAEVIDPSPRKILHDRAIYKSLSFLPRGGGLPLLTDFGEARMGDKTNNNNIMTNVYRAPKVILRSSWGYKVDIWNVAMVVS
jgi:serine/threonine protein kinase